MRVILSNEYKQFIIIQRVIRGLDITKIHEILTDEEKAFEHGLKHLKKLSLHYLRRRIQQFTEEEINDARRVYEAELFKEVLASKRNRIKELTKLYDKETNTSIKARLLKDIKEEVGEDKWLEALEKSGKTSVNMNISDGMTKEIAKAILDER